MIKKENKQYVRNLVNLRLFVAIVYLHEIILQRYIYVIVGIDAGR